MRTKRQVTTSRLAWLLAGLLAVTSGTAQTVFQWTNAAGGSWAAGGNWFPAGPASGVDAIADLGRLDLAADATVTLDGARTIGQLRFADLAPSHDWFLTTGSGGPLTLVVSAGAAIIAVSNQTATIGAVLAGTNGLGKTGRGTLVLTGANTFTGDMTNFGGTLTLRGATGRIADSARLFFSGCSTFNLDNVGASGAISETIGSLYFAAGEGTVKSTRTEAQNVALVTTYNTHALGSAGNFITAGGVNGTENKIVIGNKTGFLSGRHAFQGTNFAWVDATVVRGINYGSDGSTVSVGAGGTVGSQHNKHVRITGSISAQSTATNATLNISGPYDFTLGGGATYTFINGLLKAGGGASTISGGTAINDSNIELPIRVDTTNDSLAINTRITGSLTLTKAGAGLLSLGSTANDFTGSIYVNNGTVRVGAANVIPDGAGKGNIIVADLGTFDLGGFSETINGLSGSGVVDNLAGTGYYTLTVGANDASTVFSGVIRNTSGSLALGKAGTGTLTLAGANAYSGDTTVNGGTLAFVGSVANSTNFVLAANATLDVSGVASGLQLGSGKTLRGSGSVFGSVTVADGATLTVGATIGTLAFSSNLTLGGTVAMEISKTNSVLTNDLITCAATLSLGGTLTVTAAGQVLAGGDVIKLLNAAVFSNSFATVNLPGLDPGLSWDSSTLTVDGTLRVLGTGVPTPVTRIMPLGDSITQGTVPGGYRARLWQLLASAGFKVDFVGTLSNNTAAALPDPQHEGHSGWMINQIDANILSYLDAVEDPDLILLLLGTNDYKLDNDPTNAIHRLEALIAKIATKRPFAKIVVANLLLRTDYPALNDAIQASFNPFVPGVVSNQVALGRRVFFHDLRSVVGAADLADGLHPNQTGYNKMADSWFSAITNLAGSQGGLADAPAIAGLSALPTRRGVTITFSKPVADSAASLTNFALGGGLTLLGATLDPVTMRDVTLTTSLQAPNTSYPLTVTGIRDRTAATNLMPSTATNFTSTATYGSLANVPDAANYTLLCSLVLPTTANYNTNGTPYALDHRRWITNFSRVAYYVELQQPNGALQYLWASMDTFTPDASKLGVPSADTGAGFQQAVPNLDVRCSVPGVATGTGLSGGQINFSSAGAGAMQVWHNGNVLFALNGWGNGSTLDLGIGNNTGNTNADWTGMANAASYAVKRLLVFVLPNANPPPMEADIVVYGGTSGGVAAAVQAARQGKRAVLVCYDNHLGGLSSGGLGATDTGNTGTIGGISREFYTRIGQHYGGGIRYTFEPHAAEQTFSEMLAEAGVPVVFKQRLASVAKTGARITSITMTNGAVFRGKMFVDTTYEGDLLAAAGVSSTVGREGTNVYGESLNGIRNGAAGHQFLVNVDPYLVPGNPASGLLPYIQPGTGGTVGDGDTRVQAYNFRLCLTKTAGNKLPIQPPGNYDSANYELLGRYLAARVARGDTLTVSSFMNPSGMPNGKTDVNNNGAFSSDFIGMNYDYPTANDATRAALWQAHEDYIRGFLTFLATDSRAPATLRAEMQTWGLSLDEFLDTGGWPHAMYVREGRRMVSDYVMTQDNCALRRVAADSVGLASYNMDSHNCQRIVQNGWARNEGDVQSAPAGPFPISYRSIVPRASECENLFATFALSGTHIAFSSCRMEPVFMMTSQSAGAAACFAIDDNVPVQQVNYDKLALQLQVDGQILTWGSTATGGLIVDNTDSVGVAIVGGWTSSSATPGYYGVNYIHDGNADKGTKSVTFTPTLPTNDVYGVYLRWTALDNRAASVPVDVIHPAGTNTVFVNQQSNGGTWNLLLTTNFTAGTNARVVIRTEGTTGYVIADAVRFVSPSQPSTFVQVVATDGTTSELGGDPARVTFVRDGDTTSALTITYSLGGTASNGVDYATLSDSITIPAGATTNSLVITALPDSLAEGDETIVLTLQPGAGYSVGALSTATVTIREAVFAQITGQVALEGFVGTGPGGASNRVVTFKATDGSGAVLASWNLPLAFAAGTANYVLTNVPSTATHLSAKTAWTLRTRLPVAFTNSAATVDFTGPHELRGGDIHGGNNLVDIEDYFQLAAAWFTTDPVADIDGSGWVDEDDYFLLASHWYTPGDPE